MGVLSPGIMLLTSDLFPSATEGVTVLSAEVVVSQ